MTSPFLVDHAGIINRIISILKSNINIFNPGDAKDKLRKINFAEPDYDIRDDVTPFAYVQWDTQYESSRELYGTSNTNLLPEIAAYNIVIVVQKKGTSDTTSEISRLLDLVMPQLKLFPTLDDPANPGNPLVFRSNIVSISRLEQQKGKEKDGALIKLVCQVGQFWTLLLPAPIGLVNCLSVPQYNDDLDFDIDHLDNYLRTVTPKSEPASITIEFESNQTIDDQLKTMKAAGVEIPITLAYGPVSRTRTVVLTGFHKPVPFDNIERTSISMEVIQ